MPREREDRESREDRLKREFDELRKSLSELGATVDKGSQAIAQASAGNVGTAAASAASGAAALTSNPELAVIAKALELVAPVLDKLVSSLLPDLVVSLKRFEDVQRAGQRVSAFAEDAARYGVRLSDDVLKQQLEGQIAAENRATAARVQVANLVTDAQVNRLNPFK